MKKPVSSSASSQASPVLKDSPAPSSSTRAIGRSSMIRTQIYLSRSEHQFVLAEAARRGEAMASIIREYIDEKMRLPDTAWERNPMLEPTPLDPDFALPADAAINHDHYLYGAPKKYLKKRGKWLLAKVTPASQD